MKSSESIKTNSIGGECSGCAAECRCDVSSADGSVCKLPKSLVGNKMTFERSKILARMVLSKMDAVGDMYYDGCTHKEVCSMLGLTKYQYWKLRSFGSGGLDADLKEFVDFINAMMLEGDIDLLRKRARGFTYKESKKTTMNDDGSQLEEWDKNALPDLGCIKEVIAIKRAERILGDDVMADRAFAERKAENMRLSKLCTLDQDLKYRAMVSRLSIARGNDGDVCDEAQYDAVMEEINAYENECKEAKEAYKLKYGVEYDKDPFVNAPGLHHERTILG